MSEEWLRFNCPSCDKRRKARPRDAGKMGRCTCGAHFTVPGPIVIRTWEDDSFWLRPASKPWETTAKTAIQRGAGASAAVAGHAASSTAEVDAFGLPIPLTPSTAGSSVEGDGFGQESLAPPRIVAAIQVAPPPSRGPVVPSVPAVPPISSASSVPAVAVSAPVWTPPALASKPRVAASAAAASAEPFWTPPMIAGVAMMVLGGLIALVCAASLL